MKLLLAVYFLSHALCAESFLISEVFANARGKARDHKKEWIELLNLDKPQTIKTLTLEIYEQETGQEPERQSIALKKPLIFTDYLLIAQSADLGIDACVDKTALVVMPFALKNTGPKKICVSLNEQESSCVQFSKKSPMPDGVALFRDPKDRSLLPLWRHEPCELTAGIFATPLKPAQNCTPEKNMCPKTFTKLEPGHEPLSETLCQVPKNSLKLCHVVKKPVLGLKTQEVLEKWPQVRLIHQGAGKFQLEFSAQAFLSLTLTVGSEMVLQRAFIEEGEKILEFTHPTAEEFTLSWWFLNEQSPPLALSVKNH